MKNNNRSKYIKLFVICMTAVIVAVMSAVICMADNTESINLANVKKNERGDGWTWDNPNDTLTLNNFVLKTDADFGIKLPENAIVELVGKNYITAGKYGIGIMANATFQGEGSLIIDCGKYGIYSYSTNANHAVRFKSGTYEIRTEGSGIFSDTASIQISGGDFKIAAGDYSFCGPDITLIETSVNADSPVRASHDIMIDRSDMLVNAQSAALEADNLITLKNVTVYAGDIEGEMTEKDSYSQEKCLKTTADKKGMRKSIIFGDGHTIVLDFLLFAAFAALVITAVVVPVIRKKIKTKKMYSSLSSSEKEPKK